nr:ATP-binding protein [Actinomadura roseirufa]
MEVRAEMSVVRQGAPPAPVGRSAALASVEARLAANGSVILTGPSGIGKTTLLEAVGAAAIARGELVLAVAGTETERWVPCSGLAELLDQLPDTLTAELPREQLTGLPEPHPAGPPRHQARPAADRSMDHLACRLAFRGMLARCAGERPVLLLIDDAQWVDTESVHAIRYTVRRLASRGVRAVVAGRWPDGLATADGGGAPWAPLPDALHLPVPPLGPDELAEMFDGYGLPVRVVNTLHSDSGGNPYLALALAGAFTDRIPRHWRPAPLPQRVRGVIVERLGRLPAQARETLLMAALAIRPTADLLRRAGRVEAARDIAQAAGLGLLISEGGGVRFTPPAVGTVLAESADAQRLARAHRALAAVVPDAGPRRGQPVHGVGEDQFALQLGQDRQHAEHGAALGRGGVDALLDHVQADLPLPQLRPERHQMQHRPGQPVQAGHLQRVTLAQQLQHQIELRARGLRAGRLVEIDVLAGHSSPQERVDLVVGILVGGRHPRVAEEHASKSTPATVHRH